jgi:26S proteasome regulatory subunit N12
MCRLSKFEQSVQAYDKLLLKDAAALLKFKTQQELLLYCNQQGWQHDAQYVRFANHGKQSADGAQMQTFHNMLMYARELDRII